MTAGDFDPYRVLGVDEGATRVEVHEAYRALAARHHPDRSAAADAAKRMGTINHAWFILRDDARRAAHDAQQPARRADGEDHEVPSGWDGDPTEFSSLRALRPLLVTAIVVLTVTIAIFVLIAFSQSGVR